MINAKVGCAVFAVLVFGLALLNLFSPTRTFSENENRYLKEFPAFSRQSLWSGDYTAELDDYVIDQFAWRDGWVGLKAQSERAMLRRSSNGVYFAQEGYLIEMFDSLDRERYTRNLGYTAEFARRAEEQGVGVRTMLAPTASLILAEKLPACAPEVDQTELLAQAKEAVPGFLDVTAALSAHKDEYIYYRTDHHWTSLGAFYAYNAWLAEIGLPPRSPGEYDVETLSREFYGTTWSKASLYSALPDTLEGWSPKQSAEPAVEYEDGVSDSIYVRSFLGVKDKYSVYLGANQPVVRVKTGLRNGRRLLLIKDSYANTFAQFALADFEEVLLLDPRFYRDSYLGFLAENEVTDVLVLYNLKGFAGDTNVYFLTA